MSAATDRPVQVLALGGPELPYHDFAVLGPILQTFLEQDGRIRCRLSEAMDVLNPQTLADCDVVLDYTTGPEMTEAETASLVDFVAAGGGYLPLHAAPYRRPEAVFALIGGRFVRHTAQTELEVVICDPDHPITRGLDRFRGWDEPYLLAWEAGALHLLATMTHPECGTMPVAWTRAYGEGRVFYLSLGHDARAFNNPPFQTLVTRAVHWLAP